MDPTALALLLSIPSVPAPPGLPASAATIRETPPAARDTIPAQRRAQLVGRMPLSVTSFGACAVAGRLYAFGGFFGDPHAYGREHQSDNLLRCDLAASGTWEILPHDSEALQSVELVEHEGRLLRVGGMRAKNALGEAQELVSLSDLAHYYEAQQRWLPLTSMPGGRSSHAAAVVGDALYVIGGWDLSGHLGRKSEFYEETWVYDLAGEGGWSTIATPFARRALDVAVVDDRIVAIGGMDEAAYVSARVDVLDIETGTWSEGPELPETAFGVAVCAAAVEGEERVFASAGSGTIWTWRPGEEAWAPFGELMFPRIFHELVASGEELVALGGIAGGKRVRHLERLRVADAQAEPRGDEGTSHVRIAWPGAVRNRWAAHLRGDELYLFGGNTGTDQHDFDRERFSTESWRIDLATLEVERLADLPVPRQSMRTARRPDGDVLVFAGFGWADGLLRTHDQVFAYDVDGDAWEELDPLPAALTQFGLIESRSGLALFGGLDYVKGRPEADGDDDFSHSEEVHHVAFSALSSAKNDAAEDTPEGASASGHGRVVEAASPASLELPADLPPLPRPRRAHGCAALGERVYLVGGMADGFETIDAVDVFDNSTGTWSSGPSPSTTRISPELVALEDRLYLVAGSSDRDGEGLAPDRTIEVLDPATDAWRTLDRELPIDPKHAAVFTHRGRLLAVSTMLTEGVVDIVWLDPR